MIWSKELIKIRSSHWKSSVKKEFLNISEDSQKNRKTLCQGLFFNKVAGFWHRCFHLNFVEFLRTSFLQSTSGQLLLQDLNKPDKKLEHAQTKYYNDAMYNLHTIYTQLQLHKTIYQQLRKSLRKYRLRPKYANQIRSKYADL